MTVSIASATPPPGHIPETAHERAMRERRTRELEQFLIAVDAIIRKRSELSPEERSSAASDLQARYEAARNAMDALQASLARRAIRSLQPEACQTTGAELLKACRLERRYE
ncbi:MULTISPECIES: hypothetical protein [unclassified Pseudomonas]|uniref:hypothetical protein n=1 Tax=unclassified Pseudomonas TaxID=196821 RepID=UPI001BCC2A78|nr:hypothetical protein [Pseudomonas sp. Pc102]BBP83792.1 hypothetical protein PHLH8_34340 [Pseudomonas sp. Pc102]